MAGLDTAMVVTALYAAPLVVAAAWDVATFRIPNFLNALFLALFPVAGLIAPHQPDWLWHLAAAGAVLAGCFAMFALRLLGGGDVKLVTVAALWVGWSHLLQYLVIVALIGGGLTILLLALRNPVTVVALSHFGPTPKVLTKGAPVPYGVAIAAGGLFMVSSLPLLTG